MKSSSRIAINTTASYFRSLLGVGLALFSARWIFQSLGATDFGLFSVVGSLILFLSFFNSVMASSAARHFAFAIGKGCTEDVNRWFNTSLSIHLVLPAILIAVGWPIGEWVIGHVLTIPPHRIDACLMVFRISLVGAFVTMASIPYVAMFNAKQRIAEVSLWRMFQYLLIFVLAWTLLRSPGDRLVVYAVGMVGIHVLIHLAKVWRAVILFPECRLRLRTAFHRERIWELLSFSLWTLVGRTGGMLRNQGSGILMNLYFGPVVNSAYALANQVSVQATELSASLTNAISPEVASREGRGNRDSMINLSARASKFGTLLALFFSIPLIFEAEYVLKLWLVTPPPHTDILCQLMLATLLVDKLGIGYMFAVNAYGKIAAYQASVGGLLLMTLPLAWLFLHMGYPPFTIGFAFLFIQTGCSIGRVLWVQSLFGVSITKWLMQVALPCGLVAVGSGLTALCLRLSLMPSLARLALVCIASGIVAFLLSWFVALTNGERTHSISVIKSVNSRFSRHLANRRIQRGMT